MPRLHSALTPEALQSVCRAVAVRMMMPGAWTPNGIALDDRDNPADVYGGKATKRDALGWVLKESRDYFGSRCGLGGGTWISLFIDSRLRELFGDTCRLVMLNELGPAKAAAMLVAVADSIGNDNVIPGLYPYAKMEAEEAV